MGGGNGSLLWIKQKKTIYPRIKLSLSYLLACHLMSSRVGGFGRFSSELLEMNSSMGFEV